MSSGLTPDPSGTITNPTAPALDTRCVWQFVKTQLCGLMVPFQVRSSLVLRANESKFTCLPGIVNICLASTSEIARFRGGEKKDKTSNPSALIHSIPEGKRIIGDSGMRGEPTKISTTNPGHSRDVKKFFARARARQETLFARMKFFDVLRHRFRHDIALHKICLEAVAVIVQYGET